MTSWKELIKELNLTIKDFAKLYEIPYNTVRQWYNGSRQAPPYIKKMVEKIIELQSKAKQLEIPNGRTVYAVHIKTERKNRHDNEWREFGELQEVARKKDIWETMPECKICELECYEKIW